MIDVRLEGSRNRRCPRPRTNPRNHRDRGRDLIAGAYRQVKGRIFAEIDKDLTKLPIGDIGRHLAG